MANAKYPLAAMPPFTPQQMAWLRGYFYEEVGKDSLDLASMAKQVGVNHVVSTIESQTEAKRLKGGTVSSRMKHLTIGGKA